MKPLSLLLLGAALSLCAAQAASFPVTTTADSGAGSLRQAIANANGAPGTDTITFNIPASDSNCDPTTHVCTITPASALPAITGTVTIDGYTQPGASANTQAAGSNAVLLIQVTGGTFGFSFTGFDIQSTNCLLRGLVINLFGDSVVMSGAAVSGNTVEGCFIGASPDGITTPPGNDVGVVVSGGAKNNLIGGGTLAARNLISGHSSQFCVMIRDLGTDNNQVQNNLIGTTRSGNAALPNGGGVLIFSGAKTNHVGSSAAGTGNLISGNNYNIRIADSTTTGNTVEGNLLGTNAAGTAALGNTTAAGVDLFSLPSGNIIGGTLPGSRNIISGNLDGIDLAGDGNSVLGNYIGTDVTGTIAVPNRGEGIQVLGASGNIIGGAGAAGNVISGNLDDGITLNGNFGPTMGNLIRGNRIGVDINGAALGNASQGIFLGNANAFNNTIGGTGAGEGNIIANNGGGGIELGNGVGVPDNGNAISRNSIYDNVGLGIVMPTVNDSCDGDGGANNSQNFPVITSVTSSSSSTQIIGTLNSTANTAFTLEFFASPVCDASSFGEGKVFLGSTDVTTDGSCNASFDFTASVGNLGGQSISATATDPADNTSGFSACLLAPATGPSVLANISTRLRVETGENVLIGGFIVTGTVPKPVIIRGIGPSLPVAGILADPQLELHDGTGQLIAFNDNWQDAPNKQEIIDSTVAPTNDLESAILSSLAPGAYTAIVSGTNATTGVALVEAYDLDRTVDSQLANISTRGLVQIDDNVMIGGFIAVGGDPLQVIVRAIGPSLPVTGKLANPTLELHDGNGALLASNDNWRSDQEAEIIASTVPPTNDLESAIVMTLPPAAYTAIVRGVNGTTGVALVEVYALN